MFDLNEYRANKIREGSKNEFVAGLTKFNRYKLICDLSQFAKYMRDVQENYFIVENGKGTVESLKKELADNPLKIIYIVSSVMMLIGLALFSVKGAIVCNICPDSLASLYKSVYLFTGFEYFLVFGSILYFVVTAPIEYTKINMLKKEISKVENDIKINKIIIFNHYNSYHTIPPVIISNSNPNYIEHIIQELNYCLDEEKDNEFKIVSKLYEVECAEFYKKRFEEAKKEIMEKNDTSTDKENEEVKIEAKTENKK